MNPKKHKKTSEVLLKILRERSQKSLKFARKTIFAERIESEKIREALEYYTSNWQIFSHPGLFSIACEAVGGNPDKAVNVQAAIVMLTAALDIHDDVIDKSDVKHGRLTVFGKFGQDVALLLGNAFIVSGFALLNKSIAELPTEKSREIFESLKKSLFEIGSAHALELDMKGKMSIAPDEYMQILRMKAASVEVNMRIGAIVGKGTNSENEVLTKYGRILGTLATLRDEFIDIFEIKELRQRIQNECPPIPILYALQGKNSEEVQRTLLKKKMTNKDVDKLLDLVFETEEVKKLKGRMKALIRSGLHQASRIRNRTTRLLLKKLITVTIEDL